MPKTYTVKQVADALGFSTNTVYKYLEEGKIKATRLGSEGRFKISSTEVERLLGKPAENPTPAIAEEAAPTVIEKLPDVKPSPGVNPPKLFDWFLGLISIFIAASQLSNPITNFVLANGPSKYVFYLSETVLFFAGILLFCAEVFFNKKSKIISLASHWFITLGFVILTVLFAYAQDYWTGSFMLCMSLASIMSIVLKNRTFATKFLLFVYALVCIGAIGYIQNPEPFIFADIRYTLLTGSSQFLFAVFGIATSALALLLFLRSRNKAAYVVLTSILGLGFLFLTVSFISTGSWNPTIITLFTGSFAFILPLAQDIETFAKYTRRELTYASIWIGLSLAIAILSVQIIRSTTGNLAATTAQDKANSVAKTADGNLSDLTLNVVRAASDDRFTTLPITASSEAQLTEIAKNIYFTSSLARKVFFVNASGDVFGVYPPLASEIPSVKNESFFTQTQSTRKTVVSNVIDTNNSNVPSTVYIASPIINSSSAFLGDVVIAIDPSLLQDRLTLMTQTPGATLAMTDTQGKFLFGQNVLTNEDLAKNRDLTFTKDNTLSVIAKAKTQSLGWNVLLVQPYTNVYRDTMAISSLVFFICSVLGIGSLLVSVHLPHQKHKHE